MICPGEEQTTEYAAHHDHEHHHHHHDHRHHEHLHEEEEEEYTPEDHEHHHHHHHDHRHHEHFHQEEVEEEAEEEIEEEVEEEDEEEECAKYAARGPLAVTRCEKCAEFYPGKTDECMSCGGVCARKVCAANNLDECIKTPPFADCHKVCMEKSEVAPEQQTNAKLHKLLKVPQVLKQRVAGAFAELPSIVTF